MAFNSNLTPAELLDKKGRNYLSERFNLFLEQCKGSINFDLLAPDHICYRCATHESYKELFDDLSQKAKLRNVAKFNDRDIAIFELPLKFETPYGVIPLLELCDQKPNLSQKERFDHIEFAVKDKKQYWTVLGQFQKLYPNLIEKQSNDRGTFEIKIADDMTFIVQVEPLMNTIERRLQKKN